MSTYICGGQVKEYSMDLGNKKTYTHKHIHIQVHSKYEKQGEEKKFV